MLADDLLKHAIELLPDPGDLNASQVKLRRAISAAYYALFHRINADAVATIAPNVTAEVGYRIQRWFDHGEMKKICGRFSAAQLSQPLLGLIGENAPPDLQFVAQSFVTLQEARHIADYDIGYTFEWYETRLYVELSTKAIGAWARISDSSEANIFILSLLLWKNFERERP